jgi:hypothetical protein
VLSRWTAIFTPITTFALPTSSVTVFLLASWISPIYFRHTQRHIVRFVQQMEVPCSFRHWYCE